MDQFKRNDGHPALAKNASVKSDGNSEVAQLKSEIILLKRHNERLLKKEKRLQVQNVVLLFYSEKYIHLCVIVSLVLIVVLFLFVRLFVKNGRRNRLLNKILAPFIALYQLPLTTRAGGSNIEYTCCMR